MTISYTALLGLAQPVTGTETGQWGTVVNDEITALLEDAVANAASISVTAGNVTLSTTNGSSNQARMSTLIITGTPGTTRNVVAPSQAKIYVVINQSDGAVVIKGAATSGVTIGAGQTAQVAWNGSDFVEIGSYVHGNFVVNGNLSVNGDSTLGNAGADTTTINGQVIAANSNISKTTTLSASAPALAWIKGATYTDTGTAGGTTQALAPFTVFSAPTLSTSNIVTYTNAATVYVAGAPAAAGSATITNPYSLYVAAGDAYFGASVSATTLDLTNLEVTNIKAKDGTASMTLADSTGVVTFSKATVIEATDNTNAALRITQLGTGNAILVEDSANPDSTPFVVTATGDVGIGTSSPAVKLQVNGSGQILRVTDGTTGASIYSGSGLFGFNNQTGEDGMFGSTSSHYLYFATNGVENMRLDSSGNLGLGVTPSAWGGGYKGFQVNSTGALASNGSNATGVGHNYFFDGTNNRYLTTGSATLYLMFNNEHRWYNAPSGTANSASVADTNSYTVVALGTTTLLQWQALFSGLGSLPSLGQVITATATGSIPNGGLVTQNISFTQAMTLDASGNFYVGTTSQSGGSNITFNQPANADMKIAASASTGTRAAYQVFINTTVSTVGTENSTGGSLATGTAAYATVLANNGAYPICFATNNTERARITSGGDLGIGTNNPGTRLHASIASATAYTTSSTGNVLTVSNTTASGYAGIAFNTEPSAGNAGIAAINSFAPASGDSVLAFSTRGSATLAERMRLDSSGNLGLGVTPSAWGGNYKGFQVAATGVLASNGSNGTVIGHNFYYDGTNDKYLTSGAASRVFQFNGGIRFDLVPSGTAGDPISFTQAMTLDASGNLGVGTTSPVARLQVEAASGFVARFDSNTNAAVGIRLFRNGTNSGEIGSADALFVGGSSSEFGLTTPGANALLFGTNNTERARITSGGIFQVSSGGSVQVGGTAARATTAGTNRLDIFNGTAPVGTLSNGISIYSSSGEAYVMDAAGNATLFSPHDAETNEWIFKSKHTPTGKVLKIDVERLLKFVNDHFGLDAVHEFVEK